MTGSERSRHLQIILKSGFEGSDLSFYHMFVFECVLSTCLAMYVRLYWHLNYSHGVHAVRASSKKGQAEAFRVYRKLFINALGIYVYQLLILYLIKITSSSIALVSPLQLPSRYHPQANGKVERANQQVRGLEKQNDWAKFLPLTKYT